MCTPILKWRQISYFYLPIQGKIEKITVEKHAVNRLNHILSNECQV